VRSHHLAPGWLRWSVVPAALLLAVASAPIDAQAVEAPSPTGAPATSTEVVVTAPRMEIPLAENPAATTVVGEETIAKTSSKTIGAEEALKLVPGVKVDNQADGERVHVSIRGQGLLTERGIRGIKVLLDGLPLNDPTGFAPDLFDVDWASVRRVEVFRGPASALWGGGGSGGAISITTRDGVKDQDSFDGSAAAGSNGFWKLFGETAGGGEALSYRFSASRMMDEGYRAHTASFATNLYGKVHFQPNASTRLTAIVAGTSYFNENAEGLNAAQVAQDPRQPNPDALTYNEYQQTRRATWGLTGQTTLGANQELSYALYYRTTKWVESVPSTVQRRDYDSPGAYLQYTLHTATGSVGHHLTAGVDLDHQSIDDTRRPNMGNAVEGSIVVADQAIRQSGLGLFALDRLDLGRGWGAMAGLRWDRTTNALDDKLEAGGVDRSGDANYEKATARVGLTWNPRKDLGLYASWGQGFLPPATEELANNPEAFGGFNSALVPATSNGVEVGARGALAHGLSYDLALFHLRTEDDFGRYRIPTRPLETFYGNLGATRRWGVEAYLGWLPTRDLDVQLAYTWSHFKYTEVNSLFGSYADTFMPNAPEHQAFLDVAYTLLPSLVLGASLDVVSRWAVDPSNQTWVDGYALVNARLAYRWRAKGLRGELTLSGKNLAGKDYIAFSEPDPDGNSYQPGPRQQVFAGVRIFLE